MFRIILLSILLTKTFLVISQPIADFQIPGSVCINENFLVTDLSTGAVQKQWDFCFNDFQSQTTFNDHVAIPGMFSSWGIRLLRDGNNYFGFVTDRNSSKLYRLAFGDNPYNIPEVTGLGNPGGLLVNPEEIDLIKQNGNWYGFVGFLNNGGNLTRLDFGNSLENAPTAVNIGNFGIGTVRIRNLKLKKVGNDYYLILVIYNTNSVVVINYRDSFSNTIGSSDKVTHPIAGSNLPTGISITDFGGMLKAHMVSWGNHSVQQINFGTNLMSPPSVEWTLTFNSVNKPHRIRVFKDGLNYYGLVANESLPLAIINLKDLNPLNQPDEISTPGLLNVNVLEGLKYNGEYVLYATRNNNSNLQRIQFQQNCPEPSLLSSDPLMVSYPNSGGKIIELRIWDALGSSDFTVKQLLVNPQISPDIDFDFTGNCRDAAVNFNFNGTENPTSIDWNFDDGIYSNLINPNHIYVNAGIYQIATAAEFTNGCLNIATRSIEIYDPPAADFFATLNPHCTNQQIQFINQTIGPPAEVTSWQWDFNGEGISSDQNPSFSFQTPGTKSITLTSSIPGCESVAIQQIEVYDGPVIDFNVPNVCLGEEAVIDNLSTGNITGYSFDFGDGYTSVLANPQHNYLQPGIFQISLTGFSSLGCETVVSKTIKVSEIPTADFQYDLPCAGQTVSFADASLVTNDNITSWTWDFGDQSSGSADQSPTHTFNSSGDYMVTLSASTSYGCISTASQMVSVLPTVAPSFEVKNNCLGNLIKFIPKTIINNNLQVADTAWIINGLFFDQPSPEIPVGSAGTYSATLLFKLSNGCTVEYTDNFEITNYPIADFEFSIPCVGVPMQIQDKSAIQPNLPVSYKWLKNGVQFSTSQDPAIIFTSAGNYEIELRLDVNGCTSSAKKFLHLPPVPVAEFQTDLTRGAIPLQLKTENLSKNATEFQWIYDQHQSNEFEPEILLESLGLQNIILVASNSAGCKDTISREVQVLPTVFDINLEEIFINDFDGTAMIVIKISNGGTVPLRDGIAEIELGEQLKFSETIPGIIEPFSEKLIVLNPSIKAADLAKIDFLCVKILSESNPDYSLDPIENRICLNISGQAIFMKPVPNPFDNELSVSMILSEDSKIEIEMLNILGEKVFSQQGLTGTKGENRIMLHPVLEKGIYLLRIYANSFKKEYKIMAK